MLEAVGLPHEDIVAWRAAAPEPSDSFEADSAAASEFLTQGEALLHGLPIRPRRTEREQAAAGAIAVALNSARERFLRAHVEAVYAVLTDEMTIELRDERLVFEAADRFPGLTPSRTIAFPVT